MHYNAPLDIKIIDRLEATLARCGMELITTDRSHVQLGRHRMSPEVFIRRGNSFPITTESGNVRICQITSKKACKDTRNNTCNNVFVYIYICICSIA